MKPELCYLAGAASGLEADQLVTVSEWADLKRILPQKGAAEPGPYRTSRTPYMREIMDCLSMTSPIQDVSLMAGAQVGKSEAGNNWVGYVIDHAPGPMLLVEPTVDNAKRYSKQRIGPMIIETPALAAKVIENKSRDSSNTMLEKEFPGGILLMGGANSAAGLRSMPIRYLFADEISNWPEDVDGEGDPLELASARTTTFARRKIYKCSTPSNKGACRIEAEYLATDQRKYHVPCPHCGHLHELTWQNFIIPKDDNGKKLWSKAHMACPDCGGVIEEHHKATMLPSIEDGGQARWVPTAPENIDPQRRGYQISALYAPLGWKSWAKIAKQWIDAQGNPERIKAFVNNVLALPYEEDYSAKLDSKSLSARAEAYEIMFAPDGVLIITAGVDVQHDRIEIQIIGWGMGEEAWVIAYTVIYGDPASMDIWAQVLRVLTGKVRRADGVPMPIYSSLVDSGDGNTVNEVYAFTRSHRDKNILAGKGLPGVKPAISAPTKQDINIRGQKVKRGALLYGIGVDGIKSTIYSRLKRADPEGPGAIHFPLGLPENYYDMLTAEKQRTKLINGFPRKYWWKPDSARNEALDTFVYAYAALHFAYSRHDKQTFWQQMAAKVSKTVPVSVELPDETEEVATVEEKPLIVGGMVSLSGWKRG